MADEDLVLEDAKEAMGTESQESVQRETFGKIRTGRANPALLEGRDASTTTAHADRR